MNSYERLMDYLNEKKLIMVDSKSDGWYIEFEGERVKVNCSRMSERDCFGSSL